LGERYLWVDSLCIVQDDEDDERYFVPNMDTIYQNAVVTIIALSGKTSDAGLAGVRLGSRSCEETPFTIQGTPILASFDPATKISWSNYLGDSIWDRRAWTFKRNSSPAEFYSSQPSKSTGNANAAHGAKKEYGRFQIRFCTFIVTRSVPNFSWDPEISKITCVHMPP
jgi:hypothetical protein